jgi:mycothiol synthase
VAARVELTTDPAAVARQLPLPSSPVTAHTLRHLAADATNLGARHITLVAHPSTAALDDAATEAGWSLVRDQVQLRCPLPVAATVSLDDGFRTFDPALDAEAWLGVNNRAFAWHPEQGDWTLADLQQRLAEPWFDPDGFIVHLTDGGLDGFCWTKVHAANDVEPALGEIFVIAVDPVAHGRGLGRDLVVAGLTHLHERHGLAVGMLYVEADNVAARALYDTLGFTVHEHHRWYHQSLD